MDDTSIWLTELCLRLRLLSPTMFNTKYTLIMTQFLMMTSETPDAVLIKISSISMNKALSRQEICHSTETQSICVPKLTSEGNQQTKYQDGFVVI